MRDNFTRQCPQTTIFEGERRAEADSNRGPPVYQPNALIPLGQTGSHCSRRHVLALSSTACGICAGFDRLLIAIQWLAYDIIMTTVFLMFWETTFWSITHAEQNWCSLSGRVNNAHSFAELFPSTCIHKLGVLKPVPKRTNPRARAKM